MAEAVSLAASIAGLLNLAISVTNVSYQYFNDVRHASKAVQSYFAEISALKKVLVELTELVQNPVYRAAFAQHEFVTATGVRIKECELELQRLQEKLQRKAKASKLRIALDHLVWPLKERETQALVQALHRYQDVFHPLLSLKNYVISSEYLDIAKETQKEKVLRWLCSIDPSTNHNAACAKREPTTGDWLIKSQDFADWWNNGDQFLWLNGIPGCGKTVLCSTIIEHIKYQTSKDVTFGSAYFYFDFNDEHKQTIDGFLCSVLAQLSCQTKEFPKSIQSLYDQNYMMSSRPKQNTLIETLFSLSRSFRRVYIIVDALDECSDRCGLADLIAKIMSYKSKSISLLGTSRREQDLELGFQETSRRSISVQSDTVDQDIALHVRSQLSKDIQLRTWSDSVKNDIETALVEGAHGMFRWADCQLCTLRKALTQAKLKNTLRALPKTLDETYSRILLNIDEEYRREAYIVLQWLAFAVGPLSLSEAAEAVAVQPGSGSLGAEERLRDPQVILSICSSLVVLTEDGELRLAHYSVKEYLVSDRIRMGPASQFAIMTDTGNKDIAEICLTYLLLSDQWEPSSPSCFSDFPLLRYAAQNWYIHACSVPSELPHTLMTSLTLQLLQSNHNGAFARWLSISKPDAHFQTSFQALGGSPLYYASYCGLAEIARIIIDSGEDVNARSGILGNAVKAASNRGNMDIVRMLLEAGAIIDDRETIFQVSLQSGVFATSRRSRCLRKKSCDTERCERNPHDSRIHVNEINDVLYEAGFVDFMKCTTLSSETVPIVNAQVAGSRDAMHTPLLKPDQLNAGIWVKDVEIGEDAVTALQQAAWNGHLDVVRLLLDKGANVEARDPRGTTALHMTAWNGYEEVVKLLLYFGADTEVQDCAGGAALHFAAHAGQESVIRLLLGHGAQVNAKASFKYLTEKVAHFDYLSESDKEPFRGSRCLGTVGERCSPGRTPLHEAAWAGRTGSVRLLIEKGGDMWAQDGNGWTALHRAAKQGFADTVQLLLDSGSPTFLKDFSEKKMTAYDLALAHQRDDVVSILRRVLSKEGNVRKEVQEVCAES